MQPQERLNDKELAAHFSVSRTPVREALQMLIEQKFVTVRPSSGTFVAPLDREDMACVYQMIAGLQCMALELAFSRIGAAEISRLRVLNAALMQMDAAGTVKETSRADMDLLYLYAGSRYSYDPELRMTVGQLIEYLDGTLLKDPSFSRFVDDDSAEMISEIQEELVSGAMALHKDDISMAVVATDYTFESPETFDFVERFLTMDERNLSGDHYLIGESAMYKEFKDGFPAEKLLMTILTIAAIFLIVLVNFRSVVVPMMLVISVMSGVYVNVIVCGMVSNTMYFLGYIIVQSILMGATIDYSILLTTFYRNNRKEYGALESLKRAYQAAGHSIMTSGLILTLGPYAMSYMITDQMVAMILRPLSIGALAAILVILFILPGMMIICDRFVAPKGAIDKNQ